MNTTSVTKRGQTVIPAAIRKRHRIREGMRLAWIDDGESIRLIPLSADPLRSLKGAGKGEGLLKKLLAAREADRCRES